jgi:hypothetical protein
MPMPVVTADKRVLYSGPSAEDAELVYELARAFNTYRHSLKYSPSKGTATPTGICGKILEQLSAAEKRKAVANALKAFRNQLKRFSLNEHRCWNNDPSPNPPKVVVKNLLAASTAKDFESARCEWEYKGEIIYEGEANFTHECELCGPKELMRTNFIIHNTVNGNKLRVGSVCVKRFLILAGTSSAAESADAFDRKTKLAIFGKTQAGHIADLGREKVPEKSLVALMGAVEKAFPENIKAEDAEIILQAAGICGRAAEIFKAFFVDKNISILKTLKIQKMDNREEKRRKLVVTFSTMSRSSAYRNPADF